MFSRKITRTRVALAAASAALTFALVAPAARADEDPAKVEPTVARRTDAQQGREARAARDEGDRVTREELQKVIEAIQRLEREKVSARQDAPAFTDAG